MCVCVCVCVCLRKGVVCIRVHSVYDVYTCLCVHYVRAVQCMSTGVCVYLCVYEHVRIRARVDVEMCVCV